MVVQIKELLQQFKEKERKEIEIYFDRCMEKVDCNNIDWKNFSLYTESTKYIKNMLEKMEPHYIMAVAISVANKVKHVNNMQDTIKISIIKNAKSNEDTIDCVREDRTTIIVILNLSRKSRYYLDSEE